ncbi:MAG: flagellar hook-basal body complex protein, partial [Lachnospiraceae bacterium]|nr:flagellar hook-basal body complex protein [Lachnospiraceae bacterium]
MMRSLYSGVSGLKVHQTKMDVIGNNISNVNTIGFKSSQVNFSDILYQTTSDATGPNPEARTAGINAKKIGLGASVSSISTITTSGGSQRTDNALDIMIEGNQFFIVDKGGSNYFTKAGDFTVDASGLLCNTGGCKVMGWQVDPNDPTKCVHDRVTELRVKSESTMYVPPEGTENVYFSGNIDYKDSQLTSDTGKTTTLSFYDKLGQNYMAILNLKQPADAENNGVYKVTITDILDANRESIFVKKNVDENNNVTYSASEITSFSFGGEEISVGEIDEETGKVTIEGEGIDLKFNPSNGKFISVGAEEGAKSVSFSI